MVPEVVVQVVRELKDRYPVTLICSCLGIPRSTYYRWEKKWEEFMMESELERLIQEICVKNHYRYGHRKVREVLRLKYGIKLNRKTVQKIMQKRNLQCRVKKKRQNWINGESKIIVPNRLNRDFTASQPNEKWVTDITYLPFGTSMLYLSTIMDLYNHEIIAYQISDRQNVQLVLKTLEMAVNERQPKQVLFHSDQGAVYTSYAFQHLAKEKGITTSMSRKGNCHDHAVIESFHSSLKAETFYSQEKQNLTNSIVKQMVQNDIYYYNQIRIQAKLNYLSPIEFRKQAA